VEERQEKRRAEKSWVVRRVERREKQNKE